jgi:hypothetical protein
MKKNFALLTLIALLSSSCAVLHISPSKKISALSFEQTQRNNRFQFTYPDAQTDTNLQPLQANYHFEEVVKNAKSEQEKVLIMLNWVRGRWEHNGWNDAKTNNACTILERAEKGEKFRCVEYGIVLKNALLAVGLKARTLGLKTRDVEITKYGAGHVLSEVWLKDKQKWALVDAQFNAMPVLDGIPLNAVELQAAIIQKKDFRFVNIKGELTPEERKKYMAFIPHYLYYFDAPFDQRTLPRDRRVKIDGNRSLTLHPIGSKPLTVFQRKFPITEEAHTTSIADFYAAPN